MPKAKAHYGSRQVQASAWRSPEVQEISVDVEPNSIGRFEGTGNIRLKFHVLDPHAKDKTRALRDVMISLEPTDAEWVGNAIREALAERAKQKEDHDRKEAERKAEIDRKRREMWGVEPDANRTQ